MTNLETKVKTIKELKDEIDALYRIVRADNSNLSDDARDELFMEISIKTRDRELLINDIDAILSVAGLITRRLR